MAEGAFANTLLDVEERRDRAVRHWPCPTCGAARWRPCTGLRRVQRGKDAGKLVNYTLTASHTTRYLLGVAVGAVPPLPGGR